MSRPRPILAAALALTACALWAAPSTTPHLLILREALRFGEFAGITPIAPAPGARLAGQILLFNYHQPPTWYALLASALAAAGSLAPILLPAPWIRRRIAAGRPFAARNKTAAHLRGPLALALAGLLFAILDRAFADRLWALFLDLGRALGGQLTMISGLAIGTDGPFSGGTLADTIGNFLIHRGPRITLVIISSAAALLLHTRLWRTDARAAIAPHTCPHCTYALTGLPPDAPCPECGKLNSTRGGT